MKTSEAQCVTILLAGDLSRTELWVAEPELEAGIRGSEAVSVPPSLAPLITGPETGHRDHRDKQAGKGMEILFRLQFTIQLNWGHHIEEWGREGGGWLEVEME